MNPIESKDLAIKIVGRANMAKSLGITTQAISQWSQVPARHVFAIQIMTNEQVKATDLRPDMFKAQDIS